jgi:hypothetical protein
LEERVAAMIAGAQRFRVTQAQLEVRVGKRAAAWSHEDVSTLEVVAASIARGETTVAEQFDPAEAPVSVDELTVPDETPPGADTPSAVAEPVGDQRPATQQQVGKVIGLLRDLDVEDDDAQRAWLSAELQRPVESRRSLTRAEASTCIQVLEVLIAERGEQPGAEG